MLSSAASIGSLTNCLQRKMARPISTPAGAARRTPTFTSDVSATSWWPATSVLHAGVGKSTSSAGTKVYFVSSKSRPVPHMRSSPQKPRSISTKSANCPRSRVSSCATCRRTVPAVSTLSASTMSNKVTPPSSCSGTPSPCRKIRLRAGCFSPREKDSRSCLS
jgi:hypothetical protein